MLDRRRFLAGAASVVAAAACRESSIDVTTPASPGAPPFVPVPAEVAPERIAYGDHPATVGDLWRPAEVGAGPTPAVVLLHGGAWLDGFGLDLMDGLCARVAGEGWLAWNVEYRRIGGGGGWPTTFEDVAAGVDHLAQLAGVDLERVAFVGHSAGGHLAAWAASRHRLPDGAPGAGPAVRPVLAVSLAGVLDLRRCVAVDLGGFACALLVGGTPAEVDDRYRIASPADLLPIDAPLVAVHGDRDEVVPLTQSEAYVAAAQAAGDPAELVVVPGARHGDLIDVVHPSVDALVALLAERLG